MKIDTQKLESLIDKLATDVRDGPFSESSVTIGRLDGAVVRLQILDPFEAEDTDVEDTPLEQHDCIQEEA